jgi:class 3 adenylate cyclase
LRVYLTQYIASCHTQIGDAFLVVGGCDIGKSTDPESEDAMDLSAPFRTEAKKVQTGNDRLAHWLKTTFSLHSESAPLAATSLQAGKGASQIFTNTGRALAQSGRDAGASASAFHAFHPNMHPQWASLKNVPTVRESCIAATSALDLITPLPREKLQPLSHVGAVALFALDMLAEVERVRAIYASSTGEPLEVRIGIHTGNACGGVLGNSRPRYFVWGDATVVAHRLESSGVAGGIQVSEATARRLHSEGFTLRPHQIIYLDGDGPISSSCDHHLAPSRAASIAENHDKAVLATREASTPLSVDQTPDVDFDLSRDTGIGGMAASDTPTTTCPVRVENFARGGVLQLATNSTELKVSRASPAGNNISEPMTAPVSRIDRRDSTTTSIDSRHPNSVGFSGSSCSIQTYTIDAFHFDIGVESGGFERIVIKVGHALTTMGTGNDRDPSTAVTIAGAEEV